MRVRNLLIQTKKHSIFNEMKQGKNVTTKLLDAPYIK
jgi:hypothetical protein